MNEKYAILTPFDVTQKMLGPYLFSNTARETLGDKMELYFHDHSFTPLFIQVLADDTFVFASSPNPHRLRRKTTSSHSQREFAASKAPSRY